MTSTKSTVKVSDMTKDTVTSKKETQQVEELEQDKYKDLMVKIDEMAKQLKGLANFVNASIKRQKYVQQQERNIHTQTP